MLGKRSWLVWCLSVVLTLWAGQESVSREALDERAAAVAVIPLSALPTQGQEVWHLIHRGGPFAYDKDGTLFFNRERLLPIAKRGYYREYTVPTPGVRHRGARRIVCGGLQPRTPEACYYTADHYSSFRKIVK